MAGKGFDVRQTSRSPPGFPSTGRFDYKQATQPSCIRFLSLPILRLWPTPLADPLERGSTRTRSSVTHCCVPSALGWAGHTVGSSFAFLLRLDGASRHFSMWFSKKTVLINLHRHIRFAMLRLQAPHSPSLALWASPPLLRPNSVCGVSVTFGQRVT